MDIVTDTSVIMAVVANEPTKENLIAGTVGMKMVAPRSLPWEMGNAFSAILKRNRITPQQAHVGLEAYRNLLIRLVDVDLDEALDSRRSSDFTHTIHTSWRLRAARRANS